MYCMDPYVHDQIVLLAVSRNRIIFLAGSRDLLTNPDVSRWLCELGNLDLYTHSWILMSHNDYENWVTSTWIFLSN